MRNIALSLFTAFFLPVALIGAEGTPIGGEPYASWEEGSSDYFVMFNSLIDDQMTLYGETTNHQGDTCLLESSFTLNNLHTPVDAIVAQAYLVWMGAVDPADFAMQTDNAVHLKFSRDDGYVWEEDIIAGDAARTLGDTTDPFLFQSVQFTTDVTTGCTETYSGQMDTADVAYFTYRTDITHFFQKIAEDNRAVEEPILDGTALYGAYTFSGLDCTDHDYYKCRTTMVSNWSILVVYKSEKISNKKLYLYPGLAYMQGEETTANVSGFTLPKNPFLRLTAMTAEGDPGIPFNSQYPPELMYIKGEGATRTYRLTNDCNPLEGMSYEIYNSNSSLYGWDPDNEQLSCVTGGVDGQYFGIDVDTFLIDPEKDINLQEHLNLGATNLDVTMSVNQDAILSNYLILSVDNKKWAFDIPEEASSWPYGREKHYCSTSLEEDRVCYTQNSKYYYLIKVQNWGEAVVKNVVVVDQPGYDCGRYDSGSTEIATQFDEKGNGIDWTAIPDGPNGESPLLEEGYLVAETMAPCDRVTMTCPDTRLLRFRVSILSSCPKPSYNRNSAIIKHDLDSEGYHTNDRYALTLRMGSCDSGIEPPKSECGGGEEVPATDDDAIAGTDADIAKSKDDGCGCSVVF